MKIYYSKEHVEIGDTTGDPIKFEDIIGNSINESPYKNPLDRIIYPKPTVEEVVFRSGKEKRRERRKQERTKKRLLR